MKTRKLQCALTSLYDSQTNKKQLKKDNESKQKNTNIDI